MSRKLSDSKESTVVNALRVAAVEYAKDAAYFNMTPRLVAQYQRQMNEANALADRIETGDVSVQVPIGFVSIRRDIAEHVMSACLALSAHNTREWAAHIKDALNGHAAVSPLLALLEELLSVTEPVRDTLSAASRDRWGAISALVADARDDAGSVVSGLLFGLVAAVTLALVLSGFVLPAIERAAQVLR